MIRNRCSRNFWFTFRVLKKLALSFLCATLSICYYNLAYGQEYFQQEVNYTIHVALNDSLHELKADETIQYTNNSPDVLNELYFHLWPNAYKDNSTAMAKQQLENGNKKFYEAADSLKGYMDKIDFRVNGERVEWENVDGNIDICRIKLKTPLKSGGKITITTPFHVKLPKGIFSRLGHLGQAYQITQWYPKPAVYDASGWNYFPYLNMGEFYSEFGSFDVFITLPENYVVGATGDLVDCPAENRFLDSIAAKTAGIQQFDNNLVFPKSSTRFKTLHYHQDKIHDFAWFADKRYYVLKSEVELPHSKNKVTTWTMFLGSNGPYWSKSSEYINDAIYWYSLWNGDYPYKQCTAVDGALTAGGGMEYPNITVISNARSAWSLEQVIMHEVGHNWFYGIIGSNERKNPWMDEGINSFYEDRYTKRKYPNAKLNEEIGIKLFNAKNFDAGYMNYLAYLYSARKNIDQPINLASEEYFMLNYGAIVYMKSAIELNYLKEYLGETKFDAIMSKYFETWKFKHPQPKDFENIFRSNSEENLDWYFNDILATNKKIDYKILSYKKKPMSTNIANQCLKVKIKNKGDIASPFSVSAIKDGNITATKWFEGFSGKKTIDIPFCEFDKLKIDAIEVIPEINRKNNTLKYKGLLKKIEPPRFQLLWSMENPARTQINYFPVVGWNYYNGFMPGLALYSDPVFQTRYDYLFLPMYSFKTKEMTGVGNIGYTFYPDKSFIQNIRFGASASRFAFEDTHVYINDCSSFTKVAPELYIEFKNKNARSRLKQNIRFRNINIYKYNLIRYTDFEVYEIYNTMDYFNELNYTAANTRLINPYSASVRFEQGEKFVKSSIEANYKFTYRKIKKGFEIRWFFGGFLYDKVDKTAWGKDYRFRLSGQNGAQDYLFDNYFMGRSQSNDYYLGKQFTETEGGFKTFSYIGQTWKWLTAVNLKTSLPGKIPFKIYADIGTYDGAKTAFTGSQLIVYEAGIDLCIFKGICDIYFPLFWSSDLKDQSNFISYNNYGAKIRFTLYFNKLDPFKMIKNIDATKLN